jgi:hypothetical protein
MARMRRAHFKIDGPDVRLNGAHRGRLTIGRRRRAPAGARSAPSPARVRAAASHGGRDGDLARRPERAGDPGRRATPAGSHLRGRAVASQY